MMTLDDVRRTLYALFRIVTDAEAFDSIDDALELVYNISNPQRDYLIRVRDDALDAGNMEWSVRLSYCIAALNRVKVS
jgi:hypothetical protein